MTSCDKFRRDFADGAYGALDSGARHRLDTHLAECSPCAREYRELTETVDLLRRAAPQPTPARLDDLWDRLEPHLAERRPAGAVVPFPAAESTATESAAKGPRRASGWLAAAAIAVLAAGLAAWWPRSPRGVALPIADTSTVTATLDAELARYYARATPLLLAISNRDPAAPAAAVAVAAERRTARRLAADATHLRAELADARRRRELSFVSELEVVFLQLANLCEDRYPHGVELVRTTLDRRAILLQLSVEVLRQPLARPRHPPREKDVDHV